MSLFLRNIFCFLLLSGCLSGNIFGQISSNTADKKTVTAYSPHDTIFVFYQSPNHKLGSLIAFNPDTINKHDTINANFEWSKFDTLTKSFNPLFKNDTNVISSSVDTLKEGGYKVHIIDTLGLDTSFVAWVVFDSLHIQIVKDKAGFVPYFNSTCDYFDLIVKDPIDLKDPKPVKFKYFDPDKDTSFVLNNSLKFEWRAASDPFAIDIVPRHRVSRPDIPAENTHYYVSVTDKFGLTQYDTVVYKSIVPKAEIKRGDTITVNSAPLKATIDNLSKNGVKFTWYLGDGDTLVKNDTSSVTHTYYAPKTYHVKIKAESNEQCIDTTGLDITVDPPILKAPNVFNPDRGNYTFKAISLHYYKMIIFTRWGKKVYEETGYDSYEPHGWNGKIGNSEASEGIYYYIIEVTHWDPHPNENTDENRINDKGRYSGFFYLFR